MTDTAMQEVLDSLAKLGKQWDLGVPVGRIWGFLLFKSSPVTQKEMEEGTGYSRGLISRSLRKLKRANMITVISEGRELHYSLNTSLTDGFRELLKRFLADNIKPMIELLSGNLDKIEDAGVKKTFHELISEYKKLHLAVLIFSKILNDVTTSTMTRDIENMEVEEAAQKTSIQVGW